MSLKHGKGAGRGVKGQGARLLLLSLLMSGAANAVEISRPDLPPAAQVARALDEHLLVLTAGRNLQLEQANQRRWNDGNYEFSLRAGSAQRTVVNSGQKLKEWDVALERPLRLFNKVGIDQNIGTIGVQRAENALGDAHHEAGRLLLKLWFNQQREQAAVALWQKQLGILRQQSAMAAKRVKAGDAPKIELNQILASCAQAEVAWHQAQLRAQLAESELQKAFPAIQPPAPPSPAMPQAIEHDLAYWKTQILNDNHELAMVQAQSRIQHLLAQRGRADQIPDPTLGLRYSNEMGGNEKVAGVFLTVPLSIGHRSALADGLEQQAASTDDQAAFVQRRLESDIFATHLQAVKSFETWQQARDAAIAMRNNAELIAKAYSLGESSLSDSLSAQRIALESSLTETLAQLDANEARYRLLLDAHHLWPLDRDHQP